MGAKGAVEILYHGKHTQDHIVEYEKRFANPLVSAQRGFIDDIIEPATTREALCRDLKVLKNKKELISIPKKISNIPL